MMGNSELNEKFRSRLWLECRSTADKYKNYMVNPPKENVHTGSYTVVF